jgi:hypothetical protein
VVRLTAARPEHVHAIAACVSPRVAQELLEGFGQTPEQVMRTGMQYSIETWTAFAENREGGQPRRFPIAMYGVGRMGGSSTAVLVWCVPTVHIKRYGFSVAKASRRVVWHLVRQFDELVNFVDTRDGTDMKWLKWLGARFGEGVPPYRWFSMSEKEH